MEDGPDIPLIESEVGQILASVPGHIWDGETLPIPVDDIVDSVYGLRVRVVDDMSLAPGCPDISGTLSGLLLTGIGEIWVNGDEAKQWDGRRRFTIGHELGHYVMHQVTRPTVYCRVAEIEDDGPRPAKPLPEAEADAFSAALLMPAELVTAHHETLGTDIDALCEAFGCSQKAMNYRLQSLSL
ncbi:MAG: ImmA/IrrE family metallo-endopeptidase [Solirubrobacterales bacterium]